MPAQARHVQPGFWEGVLGPHADGHVVGAERLGASSHQTLPEPVAAPRQLRPALLHRGEATPPRQDGSATAVM